MHADYIRHASDCLRSVKTLDAETARALRCETATPRNDRHAEGACARNHLLSNLSRSYQSKRAPEETARFGKLFLVPNALPKRYDVIRYAAVERENKGEGKFSDGNGIFARTV